MSIDFVMDAPEQGRRLKCLTIVDDFTKEAIDIVVDHGISGRYVTRGLDQAAQFRSLPKVIRTHQGRGAIAENTATALPRKISEPATALTHFVFSGTWVTVTDVLGKDLDFIGSQGGN